ncbi:hypothetical protein AAHA92_10972 [Salvia divinorum]|uniref:Uncharacterized protein n=1 Tax=Salvia divinorum TaxID=28513 RepID=A0ABD1HWF0_SALDI
MSKPDQDLKFHIKVVINKEKTKVLFAEASAHFTDVLLSFLVLPFSKIMEVLEKHYGDKAPVIGSLNTLYKGAANLHIDHFLGEYWRENIINSTRFDDELSCLRLNCGTHPASSSSWKSYDGVFTDGASSFIITHDLCVFPIVGGSIIDTLSTLGIAMEDMHDIETRNLTFGLKEVIALLKDSLISSNPFTALIFPERRMIVATEGHVVLHQIDQMYMFRNSWNLILKVMLQKSTNKFLFAQANGEFVNFLFTMLSISLERVDWYLASNTGLKNMASLIANDSKIKQLKYNEDLLSKSKGNQQQAYVLRSGMYIVRDDLTVSPLGLTSGVSLINELKISLSDLKEVKLKVGLEEGLSILKAALKSTTALTDGLVNPFLIKQEMDIKPFLKREME